VFEENKMTITDKVDARKQHIDAESAWKLIRDVSTVHIGKGKKVLTYTPADDNREEILKAAIGPTGNLRAPAVRKGDRLYIGYTDQIYSDF
jgi:hypothetical protein